MEIEFEDTEMGHGKGKEVFEKMMAGFGWRVVADPFVGTGAVLLACELAGRRLLGMEMNPATLAVCLERCQVFGLDVRRADQ